VAQRARRECGCLHDRKWPRWNVPYQWRWPTHEAMQAPQGITQALRNGNAGYHASLPLLTLWVCFAPSGGALDRVAGSILTVPPYATRIRQPIRPATNAPSAVVVHSNHTAVVYPEHPTPHRPPNDPYTPDQHPGHGWLHAQYSHAQYFSTRTLSTRTLSTRTLSTRTLATQAAATCWMLYLTVTNSLASCRVIVWHGADGMSLRAESQHRVTEGH